MVTLIELPADILYSIFPYLSASEFLKLTCSTKALFSYRQDPTFWRAVTQLTFRIPTQPLLQADGARWQWLYKNLRTQTHLFTWGNDDKGSLGQTAETQVQRLQITPGRRPRRQLRSLGKRSAWPRRVNVQEIDEEVGVLADVQCGGWSTTLLNSIGIIYAFGVFNGLTFNEQRREDIKRLTFPPAYPPTTHGRYEPSTAIRQYSTGRSHVLGLADDGKVWMWTQQTAFLVKPLHVDLLENSVVRVVAGWDRSSMYVTNVGLVYWTSELSSGEGEELVDCLLIETFTVPGTGYHRRRNRDAVGDTLEARIGEVTGHIVLEGYILFTTDLNKLFCYPTIYETSALTQLEPIELTTFYQSSGSSPFEIRDLQGSYRSFALFTKSGSVLTASQPLLDAFHSNFITPPASASLPEPTRIPSLQSKSIISLSFGDYHFHALHANGNVSSYGVDSQSCGALGLGHRGLSQLRGVAFNHLTGNGELRERRGRTIWFEPLMEKELEDMSSKSLHGEAKDRGELLLSGHQEACVAMGDCFERKGSHWEDGVTQEGELGAYFALKVSAAGWHSAALVLVDEEKAQKARNNQIIKPPEPSPAPTPSYEGSVSGTDDGYEHIDAPWDQLTNGLEEAYECLRSWARWFLGLTARDAAIAAARTREEQDLAAVAAAMKVRRLEEETVYTWTGKPFPRLRMEGGEEMPGEILLTE